MEDKEAIDLPDFIIRRDVVKEGLCFVVVAFWSKMIILSMWIFSIFLSYFMSFICRQNMYKKIILECYAIKYSTVSVSSMDNSLILNSCAIFYWPS